MGLADLHIHTIYSFDGTASVPDVLARAKRVGLDVISITDHNEVKGSLIAMDLASKYEIEVIPGIEVTTAEGDLLVLNVTEKIEGNLSLLKTVLTVKERGGFCIAPHPTAGGFGMRSLSWQSIAKAIGEPQAAEILIGIEIYNATLLDREGNQYANVFADRYRLAKIGASDAHILDAIGLGSTEFPGSSAVDLLAALRNGTTIVHKNGEWDTVRILGSWFTKYASSIGQRLSLAAQ